MFLIFFILFNFTGVLRLTFEMTLGYDNCSEDDLILSYFSYLGSYLLLYLSWSVSSFLWVVSFSIFLTSSLLLAVSDSEGSSEMTNLFLTYCFFNFSFPSPSSESHSRIILETISDYLIFGNWCLYLLYLCLENSRYTFPIISFSSFGMWNIILISVIAAFI